MFFGKGRFSSLILKKKTQEVEAKGSEVQSLLTIHNEFRDNLY